MPLLPLSLIKGEYGWNVTLKRVDKQTGGRRGVQDSQEGRVCLKAVEEAPAETTY